MITLYRIREILSDWSEKDINEITVRTSLIDDLETDSLGIIELMMIFEDKLNIVIPNEDIFRINTVGDIYEYLKRR